MAAFRLTICDLRSATHVLLGEELLNILVRHDAVEEVGSRLAVALFRVNVREVVLGHGNGYGKNKGKAVCAAQLCLVHFLALQHVNRNAQSRRSNTRRIGYGYALEGGVHFESIRPLSQSLAASFKDDSRELGGVVSQHCLHRADCHTVLGPYTIEVGEGGKEVR